MVGTSLTTDKVFGDLLPDKAIQATRNPLARVVDD